MGVFFAVLSALGYGASMFFTQMGLKSGKASVLKGMMVSVLAANAALWCALLVSLLSRLVTCAWDGVVFFINEIRRTVPVSIPEGVRPGAGLCRFARVDAIPSALLESAIGTAAAPLVTGLAVVCARQVHTPCMLLRVPCPTRAFALSWL